MGHRDQIRLTRKDLTREKTWIKIYACDNNSVIVIPKTSVGWVWEINMKIVSKSDEHHR